MIEFARTAAGARPAKLEVRRTIRASAQRLFAAWTQPAHLVRWWGTSSSDCPFAEVDLRVGGRYRIANRFADGSILWIGGTFERIEPPELLEFSWAIEGRALSEERVSVRLRPHGDATEVIVRHDRIGDRATRASHESGWRACLDGLVGYVAAA